MEVISNNYMPGDPRLVQQLVNELKSQGIFDQFRKECFADVDTKPAYQNLRQRVEGSVAAFLKEQTWSPDMNKNQVREQLKKNIYESGYLETGVERIVDQVVNPKISTIFLPIVEDVVYKYLGIQKPQKDFQDTPIKNETDLLPKDLEAVSPESVHSLKLEDQKDDTDTLNDSLNSKVDDDESPPFEPLEMTSQIIPILKDENSMDSDLSGISGLQSHESNLASESKSSQVDWSWQDAQLSQNSSESKLSVMTSEEQRIEIQKDFTFLRSMDSDSRIGSNNKTEDDMDKNENSIGSMVIEEEESTSDSQKPSKVKDERVADISETKSKVAKDEEEKRNRENKFDDTKRDEKKRIDDRKSKSSSSHRYSSKEDKHRKDKDKSTYKSESKDRDKDKDKNKDELKSSKDKNSKTNKDRGRYDKDKAKERDKCSSKSREKCDETKEKHDKDKNKSKKEGDKDKEKPSSKEKSDKQKSEKDKSRDRSEKDSSEKSSSKSDKNKDKKDKDRKKSSSSANGKSSSTSSSDKKESSSSSSKKKENEKSDKTSKLGDKHKKEEKSSEVNKDKKRDSKKDDHYSSKEKKNHRRSFDRDSNDGHSGKTTNSNTSDVKLSSSQNNTKDSSANSFSGSGDSGNSDAREDNACDVPDKSETPSAIEVPKMKYIKPKFALNFEEAKRIMKIRKQLAMLERQNQLSLADLNMHNGLETITKEKIDNKHEAVDDDTQTSSPFRGFDNDSDEVKEIDKEKGAISDLNLQSILMSKESWEALEARLEQEMKKINFTAYESHYDDYDDNEYSAITYSPRSDNSCVVEEIIPKNRSTHEKTVIVNSQVDQEQNENSNEGTDVIEEVLEAGDQVNEITVETEEVVEEIVEYDDMMTEVDFIEELSEENSIKSNEVSKKQLSVRLENIGMQDECLNDKVKCQSKNNHLCAIDASLGLNEVCTHLEKPDVAITQCVAVLNKLIGKLECDLEYSIKEYQNNILPEDAVVKRGRKRKINDGADCENNNRLSYGKMQGSIPKGKRYDSDDLYKPRPIITSTRRNKRDKNP